MKRTRVKILLDLFKSVIALLIVAGTLVIIIWIGTNFYNDILGKVPDVVVPSLVNMDIIEAKQKIKEAGFEIEIQEQYNQSVPKDMIISQKPSGGRKVKTGRKVFVTVSLGGELVNVPNLKGLTSRDAEVKLNQGGLKFLVEKDMPHDEIPRGKIIEQNPSALSQVARETTVQVILSSGPSVPVEVPDVVGMTIGDARSAIENTGFVPGKIVWVEDNRFKPGSIITQLPDSKEKLKTGSLISLEAVYGKNPESNILFQQDLVTIMVPKSNKDVEVEVLVIDRYGSSRVYHGFHKGGQKFEVSVCSTGSAKLEIFFNGVLELKADL
ncbi:MAG TPA: PASTA domain-containing protein [Candidatus Eremiobacteraeota bacterium]|nr:MAG: Serine/threonine-protein kinase PK-1 [bacterium ADurb.Bin363]HPZ08506.1 PASTA domain-containing protein [Candidatus Eremiobacteraeota bacterium]